MRLKEFAMFKAQQIEGVGRLDLRGVLLCIGVLVVSLAAAAQTTTQSAAVTPRLVKFSSSLLDEQGQAVGHSSSITFSLYSAQTGGTSLWSEVQSVQPDSRGRYTVSLGVTRAEGLPLEIFSTGEARWLGVTVGDGSEQPRVLLFSVPYALKAADAETIGGLPPSAFVLAAPSTVDSV